MKNISVLLADDHVVVRMGLKALLSFEKDIVVLGEADDGEDAVSLSLEKRPDVVIMDLRMPKMDGAEATKVILEKVPQTHVLILTTFENSDDINRALRAGAVGAILKSSTKNELASAIRLAAKGKRILSPEIERELKEDPPVAELTARQKEILHSVTRGLTNQDIARQFDISPNGVKAHLNAIFSKLGASGRSEAVAIALRKHLLKK